MTLVSGTHLKLKVIDEDVLWQPPEPALSLTTGR